MPRFVVKQIHSDEPADGAAQQWKEKQHPFGDPSAMLFCLALVDPHCKTRGEIDSDKIKYQDMSLIDIHDP